MDISKPIFDAYSNLKHNNFATLGESDIAMWQLPLIGVAAGDDPYFMFLKEHIGEFHWSPRQVFESKYGEAESCGLRVVSIAFPQSEEAKAYQRKVFTFPSDKWLVSRGEWEPLMNEFSTDLVRRLDAEGIRSISIDLVEGFHLERSVNSGIASSWSHRHAAFAAGLGTFGLTDALITEKGTAVRITSLIVEADLDITEREYSGPYDWCLHYQNKKCDLCIDRCPTNAITVEGHDKDKCNQYEEYIEKNLWPAHIDRKNYIFGCGICQVNIPCQNRRP